MKAPRKDILVLGEQLQSERKLVSFDSYDLSVRQLLDMFEEGAVTVPPEYQRQFIWDERRQSELIESVFLGIPVPSLFMATNPDASWEVVDGVQRLGTLVHFCASEDGLRRIEKEANLRIRDLEKLSALNGSTFGELPKSFQLMFTLRPIRVTVLNDKSDLSVRFDLFERLNTGGISLTQQEIRNCVYRGPFNDSIKALSKNPSFRALVKVKPADENNGTREELVLRFFAFLDRFTQFDHSVKDFLNSYMKEFRATPLTEHHHKLFNATCERLTTALPNGIVRGNRNITPVNLYEAIAVGTALAISAGAQPQSKVIIELLNDPGLKQLTTGATNSNSRVTGRINYVRDALTHA